MGCVLPRQAGWFVGCLLAALALPICATESAQRYGCERPIRLSLLDNSAVYRDGKGIDPDMVAELQRRSGCPFEISLLSRSETWAGLEAGTLDMATSAIATEQRHRFAHFVPYLYVRYKLIVPVELAPQMVSFADLQHLPDVRLGIVAGYRYGPYFDSGVRILRGSGRVREYPSDEAIYAALLRGEINALVGHDLNFKAALSATEQKRFLLLDVAPGPGFNVGLVLARKRFSVSQAAAWLRLMEGMRLDGRLRGILQAHASAELVEELLHSSYRSGGSNHE